MWFGSRTFQVPVIQLENVLEQEGGEQLQASDTVVLGTGRGRDRRCWRAVLCDHSVQAEAVILSMKKYLNVDMTDK